MHKLTKHTYTHTSKVSTLIVLVTTDMHVL